MPCSYHDKPSGWDTSFGQGIRGRGVFVAPQQSIIGAGDDEVRRPASHLLQERVLAPHPSGNGDDTGQLIGSPWADLIGKPGALREAQQCKRRCGQSRCHKLPIEKVVQQSCRVSELSVGLCGTGTVQLGDRVPGSATWPAGRLTRRIRREESRIGQCRRQDLCQPQHCRAVRAEAMKEDDKASCLTRLGRELLVGQVQLWNLSA